LLLEVHRVARLRLAEFDNGRIPRLIMRVARDDESDGTAGEVHEPGAVHTPAGQPAPEVRHPSEKLRGGERGIRDSRRAPHCGFGNVQIVTAGVTQRHGPGRASDDGQAGAQTKYLWRTTR